uniref:Uncharacterized protein n=1 Tax=Oryza sativa subsp. japonica TaxID=39947 RepID=Q6K2X6_ORYSJ|nr:hypothetical protein [Oryza sativa Japonica Group]
MDRVHGGGARPKGTAVAHGRTAKRRRRTATSNRRRAGEDDGGGLTVYCGREVTDSDRDDVNREKKAGAVIGASGAVVELMVVVA